MSDEICKTCIRKSLDSSSYCQECLDLAKSDGMLESINGKDLIKGRWHRPDSLHDAVSRLSDEMLLAIFKSASISLRNEQVKAELMDKHGFSDFVVNGLPNAISDTYENLGEQLQAYNIDDLAYCS